MDERRKCKHCNEIEYKRTHTDKMKDLQAKAVWYAIECAEIERYQEKHVSVCIGNYKKCQDLGQPRKQKH